MLTTPNAEWAARARRLREHAMSVSAADRAAAVIAPPEEYGEIGFNYRMTDMQAAVGLVQLGRLDAIVARRREIAAAYREAFGGIPGLRVVEDPEYGTANFQSLWVEVGDPYPLDREGLMIHLAEADISARRGIMAAHRQPAYADRDTGDVPLPVTDHLTDDTLILPVFHQMTDEELQRVIDAVRAPVAVAAG
jgi:dTDP-4-amino-4,6-dideoxygalactose transaminase